MDMKKSLKKEEFLSSNIFNSKKGLSIMIGYVLLITFAIIIAAIVYNWIVTYVPRDSLKCPEGVSVFAEEALCLLTNFELTLKNNGRFDIAGYFIHATNKTGQELATIDLSQYLIEGANAMSNSIIFIWNENAMKPNDEKKVIFEMPTEINSFEVIPVRFQVENNKKRFVTCSDAKVKEMISCDLCKDTCGTFGYECGTWTICDVETICLPDCDAEAGEVCTADGFCVLIEECYDTCLSLEYECGIHTLCGEIVDCNGCPIGPPLLVCNNLHQCELACGNGVIDAGEECDDGRTDDGDGCSSTCVIETPGWTCIGEPSVCSYCNNDYVCDASEDCLCSDCDNKRNGCALGFTCQGGTCLPAIPIDSCKSYCFSLNIGYDPITSSCAQNCGGSCPGTCEPDGIASEFCASPTIYCCCVPYA